ncbi:MAG: hypothetical protein KDJ74_05020, partial [Notoacmeibacter sp.]|nr:hypothetical protein [Notoacmeibacter sp.]
HVNRADFPKFFPGLPHFGCVPCYERRTGRLNPAWAGRGDDLEHAHTAFPLVDIAIVVVVAVLL